MKKLKLDLDDLRIDSFDTTPAFGERQRGTVVGAAPETYYGCNSEGETCDTCRTCNDTCWYTCGVSCGGTCNTCYTNCGTCPGQWTCDVTCCGSCGTCDTCDYSCGGSCDCTSTCPA